MRLLSLLTALLIPLVSTAQMLEPGSPAPAIDVREWVKGKPLKTLDPKVTYVIEFWATWCGPCIENIPHLTKIAKENKGVQVLGISVFEKNEKQEVQAFVKGMGDKMGYTVGFSGYDDKMAETWMAASKSTGIPQSFVVKGSKVMWIGHPAALDRVLAKVKDGTWDVEAARDAYRKRIADEEAYGALLAEIEVAKKEFVDGHRAQAKARLAKIESNPRIKNEIEDVKFLWACIEDPEAWKVQALAQIEASSDEGSKLAMFTAFNAADAPDQCVWLNERLTARFPDNWYPWLCGARMFRSLKQWDKALAQAERSRQAILTFQAKNPNAQKGNALDVIADLEAQIKKDRGG